MPQMRVPPDFGGLGAACASTVRATMPAASAYRPAPPAMPACRKSLRDIDLASGALFLLRSIIPSLPVGSHDLLPLLTPLSDIAHSRIKGKAQTVPNQIKAE